MKVHLLGKRYYTNKDLLNDRFGRLYHLPVQLARLGADVSVTAVDYRNPRAETVSTSGVSFSAAPATPAKLPGLIFDLYRTILTARPDVLIASGDSHIGYIGLRIARRLGIRFAFDVYDYYPAFPGNRIPGMKWMFRSAVKNADLVLYSSEQLQGALSTLNRNTLLVENGVDRGLFMPMNMGQARGMFDLEPDVPLVGFFGSIAPNKGPLLIEACRILRDDMPELTLLLAGRVTDVNIEKPWIIYLGELPQASVPILISACNVVAVPLANHPQNDLSGACKIAEYLACGKPVVATRVSNHERIFEEAPGSLCDPDPEDMARVIRCQLGNPEVAPFPKTLDWEWVGSELYESLNMMQS